MIDTIIHSTLWYLFGIVTVIICQDNLEYWYKKLLYLLGYFVSFCYISMFLL